MSKRWPTVALVLIPLFCWAKPAINNAEMAVLRRIQPVGSVYIGKNEQTTISDNHHIAKTASHQAPAHATGNEIYSNYCYICHEQGAAGAPIVGNAQAWGPRHKKGLNILIKHALEGYHFMPPRGTCLECSDKEIAAAVQYMSDQSISKPER
jgi:cytochrome c5